MSKCEDMLANENLSPLTLDDEWDKSSSSTKRGELKSRITDDEVIKSLFMSSKERERAAQVKCNFYFKIGACRHGDRCTKSHREPTFSQTVLLKNLYWSPLNQFKSFQHVMPLHQYTAEELQQHFDETYEELYVEIDRKYGEIEELLICDNIAEHLAGNAYIKFRFEEDAERAVLDLNNRWFNLKPIYAELSPVTDFTEARCQHEFDNCPRNGHCNFLHVKEPSSKLVKKLRRYKRARSRTPRPRSRSRSRSLPWLSELYVKRLDTSRSRSRSIDNSKRSSSSSKSSSSSSKRSKSSKKKHHSKHRSHHRHRRHHHRKHKRS